MSIETVRTVLIVIGAVTVFRWLSGLFAYLVRPNGFMDRYIWRIRTEQKK